MDYFDKLADQIKKKWKKLVSRTKSYLKRLLIPIYLFPIKLITYSTYYLIKFLLKLVFSLIKIFFETIIFPFKSLKNFLKSLFIILLIIYMGASIFVIGDYLINQYGNPTKFLCSFGVKQELRNKVVRVVGGYGEGSGFFTSNNQVMTNFHVIADEPSPKIIFPDGSFTTVTKMVGDKDKDIAVLTTETEHPDLILQITDNDSISEYESMYAIGYPLGTGLKGIATIVEGKALALRDSKYMPTPYIQSDITLVEGMSGGPLTDRCGKVMGINTLGIGGQSLFISGYYAQRSYPDLTDQNITKIKVDPSKSPADAVKAFYTYLKARRMEEGFNLLSNNYRSKTDFSEWTGRFTDILDVDVVMTMNVEDSDTKAAIKFGTKNWVDEEVDVHYYEGIWDTVFEDGVYKMNQSKIIEVFEPSWEWFYE